MIDEQVKDDFSMKLKHLINTPSDTRSFYDEYQAEHTDVSFNQYVQKLESLVDRLQEDEFEDRKSFCQEVRKLHVPDDQFGC
jgi:thiaminase